jgi:hypothetical protein
MVGEVSQPELQAVAEEARDALSRVAKALRD